MGKSTKLGFDKPIVLSSYDPAIWDQVAKAKRIFIETGSLPAEFDFIPAEIVSMWKKSLEDGVQWDAPMNAPFLSDNDFAITSERKKIFIDVATQFLDLFQEIVEGTDYVMSITDENGILLRRTRNSERIWSDTATRVGRVMHERYIGCCSHTLALAYKRPVQIIGPANFLKILENNLGSAAPVFNEDGDTVGSVMLIQRNAENTSTISHALGWVTAIATAISNQLKLFRRDARLHLMNSTLQAAFAHAVDGYISIDDTGQIIHINNEAMKWLGLAPNDRKANLFSLLLDPSPIVKALQASQPASQQGLVLNNGNTRFCADIEPFFNDRNSSAQGAIIRLKLQSDTEQDNRSTSSSAVTFDRIIGTSKILEELKETAKIVAEKPINILLLGESGTGKEVFAQAIHNYGSSAAPFVAINCAAIPANLIESELFGYEGGAFTGAEKKGRMGKIEHADGGTLFLDEIGDMPLELQAVLLRVLEEKKVTRIGGHKSIPVNFRLISATNKPLFDNLNGDQFRQDLYFRLAVVNLELPPLRERGEDILLLAEYFIDQTCSNFNMPLCTLADDAQKILLEYSWPGNVRQLQNAMIYAVTISRNHIISAATLPREIREQPGRERHTKLEELKDLERDMILATIEATGNAKEAAKQLGISRATLYRKIKE